MSNRISPDAASRFASQVQKTPTCWIWTGRTNVDGYGSIRYGIGSLAHRLSYELHVGPIPDGLVIDHLCRVRNCVNPAHLEPVTAEENGRRGLKSRAKESCIRGHVLADPNLVIAKKKSGARNCLACARARIAVWKKGGDIQEVSDIKYRAIMAQAEAA